MPTEDQNQNIPAVDASLQSPNSGKKKVLTAVVVLVVLVVVLTAVWIVLRTFNSDQTSPIPPAPSSETAQEQGVNEASDIEKLEKEVNDTDVDSLTKDLDSNDKDASSF